MQVTFLSVETTFFCPLRDVRIVKRCTEICLFKRLSNDFLSHGLLVDKLGHIRYALPLQLFYVVAKCAGREASPSNRLLHNNRAIGFAGLLFSCTLLNVIGKILKAEPTSELIGAVVASRRVCFEYVVPRFKRVMLSAIVVKKRMAVPIVTVTRIFIF